MCLSVEYGATNSPVIDEEERPLSQAELRTRIMKEVRGKGKKDWFDDLWP